MTAPRTIRSASDYRQALEDAKPEPAAELVIAPAFAAAQDDPVAAYQRLIDPSVDRGPQPLAPHLTADQFAASCAPVNPEAHAKELQRIRDHDAAILDAANGAAANG